MAAGARITEVVTVPEGRKTLAYSSLSQVRSDNWSSLEESTTQLILAGAQCRPTVPGVRGPPAVRVPVPYDSSSLAPFLGDAGSDDLMERSPDERAQILARSLAQQDRRIGAGPGRRCLPERA
jgi:hypothetical protein